MCTEVKIKHVLCHFVERLFIFHLIESVECWSRWNSSMCEHFLIILAKDKYTFESQTKGWFVILKQSLSLFQLSTRTAHPRPAEAPMWLVNSSQTTKGNRSRSECESRLYASCNPASHLRLYTPSTQTSISVLAPKSLSLCFQVRSSLWCRYQLWTRRYSLVPRNPPGGDSAKSPSLSSPVHERAQQYSPFCSVISIIEIRRKRRVLRAF